MTLELALYCCITAGRANVRSKRFEFQAPHPDSTSGFSHGVGEFTPALSFAESTSSIFVFGDPIFGDNSPNIDLS
ncbi:hypothetical protein RRG08_023409 [Elysia crispata]|uniref:Uncharacterized protein n=1 Tax=Elysia crispata TaxID=231223 RepID=A0AAE0YEF4_9GAST|nr:hypothetical protein RRG08_023409 [Elysia crispata]